MPELNSLSVFLITRNEAEDIEACLRSLQGLAEEVIVVDDHSTDETVAICRRLGAKVLTRTLDGFGTQKQFALEQTTGAWALSIDADERVTPALAAEIRALLSSSPAATGYRLRRNFYFLGHRLRFGGVGSDRVLRLFRRDRGHFRNVKVHESIEVMGPVGDLQNPLEHYSYSSLGEYLDKCNQYTTLAAQDRWARGKRFAWWDHLRPFWELIVRVGVRGAWLDGQAGLIYAALSAHAAWLRAIKLWELEKIMSERILIVRTDRIGDVLLTTPVARRLRQRRPQAKISFLVEKYTAPLLEHNPDIDQIIIDDHGPMDRLVERLRRERFDIAVVAYPRWRMAWALWRAGIPIRIGPASKWYSLFFTHRLWQHRSEGKKHEADYNLELLQPLGIDFERAPTRLVLTREEQSWARATLEGHRISFHKPVVILHPGSGGSSERWPLSGFMELGDRLQEQGCDVVVTSGPGENYQYLMIDHMRRIPVFIAAGSVSLRQFAALVGCANLVVSNSTGPLHIAVALGVPTVSIYSPIPTCHPRRWGPYPDYVQGGGTHGVAMPRGPNDIPVSVAEVSVDEVLALCQKRLNLRGVSVG